MNTENSKMKAAKSNSKKMSNPPPRKTSTGKGKLISFTIYLFTNLPVHSEMTANCFCFVFQ